jgi:hypothetical protein
MKIMIKLYEHVWVSVLSFIVVQLSQLLFCRVSMFNATDYIISFHYNKSDILKMISYNSFCNKVKGKVYYQSIVVYVNNKNILYWSNFIDSYWNNVFQLFSIQKELKGVCTYITFIYNKWLLIMVLVSPLLS